jgi:hypothetical protein
MYILDQGYSRGNRFTVPFPLQNDICDLFKFLKQSILEVLFTIGLHVTEIMRKVIKVKDQSHKQFDV